MSKIKNLKEKVGMVKSRTEDLEESFLKDIRKAQVSLNPQWDSYKSDTFSPSSLGFCKRLVFFKRLGVEKDKRDLTDEWTYNVLGILNSGTSRHEDIQDELEEAEELGILKNLDPKEVGKEAKQQGLNTEFLKYSDDGREGKFQNDDIKIRFYPDGLINYNGKDYVVEIKTISLFGFNKIDTEPLEKHLIQGVCYSIALGIDRVIFIYEDRNFGKRKVVALEVTEEMKQQVKDRVEDIDGYVQDKIVPPKNTDFCNYCDWNSECKKWDEGEKFKE